MRATTPRVSIVLPTYKGVEHLQTALSSIESQSIPNVWTEVIIVPNGPDDGTDVLLDQFSRSTALNLRIFTRATLPGAGAARNIALARARGDYICFLDDDDALSNNYIEELLNAAGPSHISCAWLSDLDQLAEGSFRGCEAGTSYVNSAICAATAPAGSKIHFSMAPSLLSLSAAKLIPRSMLSGVEFDESLKSGEDVAYFAGVAARHPGLMLALPKASNPPVYLRRLRHGSVSRQSPSWEFSVRDRVQVAQSVLSATGPSTSQSVHRFGKLQARAQLNVARRFLFNHPHLYPRTVEWAQVSGVALEVIDGIRPKPSVGLIASFCFPPDEDTSGLVMAKRLLERRDVVDVISADMSSVRRQDSGLLGLVAPYIGNRERLSVGLGFGNVEHWLDYCKQGTNVAEGWVEQQGSKYEYVYSRAMWPASHFLGSALRAARLARAWIAEFSDPLSRDVTWEPRQARAIQDLETRSRVATCLGILEIPEAVWSSPFLLAEFVAFQNADVLVFTNTNQMLAMADYMGLVGARGLNGRAVIAPHPRMPITMRQEITEIRSRRETCEAVGEDSERVLKIAYFGNFYRNRGLEELSIALDRLRSERGSLEVAVYSDDHAELVASVPRDVLRKYFRLERSIGYRHLPQAVGEADVVLIVDARTRHSHGINPYLPSKLADFRHPGTHLWGIAERGSPLYGSELHFRSRLGDVESVVDVLRQLLHMR